MMTNLDPNDPESLSKFLHETSPDAAKDSIRKAIVFGWWLLPKDQRTDENLEREIRRIVDDAIRDFREDKDNFLSPEVDFSDPTQLMLGRKLLLKVGQDRFGPPVDRIRDRIATVSDGKRLKDLFARIYSASSWDDLMGEP